MAATAQIERPLSVAALFDRYHVGWETKDPDLIASLHAEDTVFALHDGTEPVTGRERLREHCRQLFATFEFTQEMGRRLYGENHWVFEWTMLLSLTEPGGAPFVARVGMLDVVTLNDAGEVVRKDVYPNGREMHGAFVRAGIDR